MLSFSVRSLARDALVWVGVEACAAEDLALVNELLAFAEEHGMGDEEPLGVEVGPVIEYLADEPEGIAAYLACQAMLDHRHGTPPSRDAMVRQAEALAGRFPGTKTAALGLLLAARISRRDDASRERLHSRLAAECPDSTENLLVEVSRLTADREFEKAQPYWDELLERHGNDEGRLKLPEPLRDAADSYDLMAPTEAKRGLDERVAANREQWGPWLVDAGITDDELRSMDWRGVPAAIRERLPERELEFLLSLDGDALRGQAYRIDPIIERHPGDPRIYEILWRLGQEDHLVRIVAAGPETPHFAEAVDQLDTWTPPRREVVRAVLARAHAMAREHAGTPAEVVGLSRAVKALLQRERPERAMEVLEESLAAIEGTRPLRERLVGLRPAIERQLVEKHRGPRLRQLWEVNLEGERVPRNLDTRHTRPVTADGRVYVPTYTESGAPAVVCVDCDSGERVWIRETGHGPLTVEVVGNRVCVSAGAVIDGLDAQTGELVWRNGPGISAKGRIWCGASGDAICAYWDQGLLFAINAETGETLWEKDGVLQEQAPSVSEGLVLTVTKDFDVIARSTETGDELWRAEWEDAGSTDNTPRSRAAMQAGILAGGQPALLVGWSREVAILVLEPATGDVTLRKELRGPAASQTRLVSCKSDVVVVADNEALGLSPVDGRTRWIVPELAQGALAIQATDRICLVFDGSELTVVDAKIGGAMGQHRLERGYTVPAT
ncbi:MAG TPA: PQQ-binding-like beta-propeller repeat protein, partial [Armatimonadota bacterium]|nr:PQQ-binding-like beta-propeller repeat protein [Armatimonadota bacterium]